MNDNKDIFKKTWIKEMSNHLKLLNPDMDIKDIKEFVEKEYNKNVVNTKCSIANNYIMKEFKSDLLTLIDWIIDTKPVIAGYGTFYANHYKSENPNAILLKGFMDDRSKEKKKLKSLDYNSYEYEEVDRNQSGLKRNSNSFYGGALAATSQFYNEYVGESITASGQSLISTSELFFESFICGKFKIENSNDLVNYISKILNSDKNMNYPLRDITLEELHNHLYERMIDDREFLYMYISKLNQFEINKVYYSNNFEALYNHQFFKDILIDIYKKVDDFRIAEKVPDNIKPHIEKLWNIVNDVVFYNSFFFDRIYRFKEDKRSAAVLCDTDSVISSIDKWVQFIRTDILPLTNKIFDKDTKYIAVSTMANLMTRGITKTIDNYCKSVNIPEEFGTSVLKMKNEFYMPRMALASTKKRYISIMELREGDILDPPKFDAKGMDFLKGTTRQATKEFMFDLCKNHILLPDNIDVKDVRKRLKDFGEEIRQSLTDGKKDFLIPANVKEIEAYAKPLSNQNVMAVMIWNHFMPNEKIILPDIIDKVAINLHKKEYIAKLKDMYPDKYEILFNVFLDESNTFSKLIGKDCKIIAIPHTQDKIPDWIIPFIDYDKIINDNLNRFNSVNESLGLVVDKLNSDITTTFNFLSI